MSGDIFHDLRTALLDFADALHKDGVPLIIGGGYGLFLWQTDLMRKAEVGENPRTLLDQNAWPQPRSTQDLDVFLTGEIITNQARFASVCRCLQSLGYQSVPGREHWQFRKQLSDIKSVVLDIITGPVDDYADKVKADSRRVSPRPNSDAGLPGTKVPMHARHNKEAISIDTDLRTVLINGTLSSGKPAGYNIRIPHPFPYLIMKLNAYNDRKRDTRQLNGAHHALDVYRIVAMATEPELNEVREKWMSLADREAVEKATRIIQDDFHSDGLANNRIRGHELGKHLPAEAVEILFRFLQSLVPDAAASVGVDQ